MVRLPVHLPLLIRGTAHHSYTQIALVNCNVQLVEEWVHLQRPPQGPPGRGPPRPSCVDPNTYSMPPLLFLAAPLQVMSSLRIASRLIVAACMRVPARCQCAAPQVAQILGC